jgi:hypothetical protein
VCSPAERQILVRLAEHLKGCLTLVQKLLGQK